MSSSNIFKKRIDKVRSKSGLTLLEGWARSGLSMKQIAKNIGITDQCLYLWFKKYPEIKQAVEKGKEVVDYEVENALYKTAMGFELVEQQLDNKGNKRMIKRTVPPNVAAQIFWLKNRRPDRWRDKNESEVSGAVPIVIKDDIE